MAANGMLQSAKPTFLRVNVNKPVRINSARRFLAIRNAIQEIAPVNSSDRGYSLLPLKFDSKTQKSISTDKMDSWFQESVSHIVQNLKQAPLLVQIYSENGGADIKTDKANSWPLLKREWEREGLQSPDMLIFVEELDREDDEEGVGRFWGLVVQGKGMEAVPKCYLLKTNRVCAGFGLGFCTHFCLMSVLNFRDCASEQFKNALLAE